jgi:hypothetical protein
VCQTAGSLRYWPPEGLDSEIRDRAGRADYVQPDSESVLIRQEAWTLWAMPV